MKILMDSLLENSTVVLKRSFDFAGRSGRSEYWWFVTVSVAIAIVFQVFDFMIDVPVLSIVFVLAMLLPSITVSIRRLHDSDRSGWWLLVGVVPVLGAFAVLALMLIPGTDGENQFGKKPLLISMPSPFAPSVAGNTNQ